MDFPRRVFDGEGVKADVDFGPTLMLNRNRCILCTRCVRFMREIDGDAQIGIVDRGNGSEIATFREEGVHSLLSGNLMDVCPVGAITTRDYRFKSRPWDNPDVVDTICTLCSKGCNTSAWLKAKPEWAKGSQLDSHDAALQSRREQLLDVRHRPLRVSLGRRRRRGCAGRWLRQRHDARAGRRGMTWSRELRDAHSVSGLGGSRRRCDSWCRRTRRPKSCSCLKDVVEGMLGRRRPERRSAVTWARSEKPQPPGSEVHRAGRRTRPNVERRARSRLRRRAGNGQTPTSAALRTAVAAGRVKALYVVDPGPDGSLGDVSWIVEAPQSGTLPLLVVQGVVMTELAAAADIVLPGAAWVEKDAILHQRPGARAGRVARHRAARRGAARTGRSSPTSRARLGCTLALPDARPMCGRAIAAAHCRTAYADADNDGVRAAGLGAALAAGVEPLGTLEVGFHVPGPAAGEGAQRPDGRRCRRLAFRSSRWDRPMRALAAAVALLLALSASLPARSFAASRPNSTPWSSPTRAPAAAFAQRSGHGFPTAFTFSRTRRAIRRSSRRCSRSTPPDGVTRRARSFSPGDRVQAGGQAQPLAVFEHEFAIGVRFEMATARRRRPIEVPAHLRYQACDDKLCYRAGHGRRSLDIDGRGAKAPRHDAVTPRSSSDRLRNWRAHRRRQPIAAPSAARSNSRRRRPALLDEFTVVAHARAATSAPTSS